jgi:hypothetical protein
VWRSEDEMLEVVQRRAAATRDRRRALLTGSTAGLLLVAALAVTAVRSGDDDGSQQVSVAAPVGGVTTTVFLPQISVVLPPIDLQPALPTTPTPTATAPRATPSIRPGASTTTPTTAASPSTTAAPLAVCSPDEVTATATAAKPAFATGEPVRLTGTLSNTSGGPCALASLGIAFTVKDAAGQSVGADRAISAIVDCFDSPCAWSPGAEETSSWCWDQRRTVAEATSQAPPGRYTITLTWTGRVTSPVSASVTVDVLPPPAGITPPPATC